MIANLVFVIWVEQYNNTYHDSTGKKQINTDYSALTGKLGRILKLLS